MTFKTFINGVYRESVPDPENNPPAAGPVEPTPEQMAVIDPDAVAPAAADEPAPEPEEVSLWDQLDRDMDEPDDDDEELESLIADEPLDVPEPEETTPEAPAEPEVVPEVDPPAEPVAADTAVPEEPVATPTPEEPEPEPTPQITEEQRAENYAARRTEIETNLTTRFGITDDEALQLVTNPSEVFPKLQARMFADMWLNVEAMVDQRLPRVIEATSRDMKVRDEKVNDFFKAWPKLNRKEHGAQVAQVAAVFSQVNKGATEAEVIKNVGMQVMMMAGIAPDLTEVPPATPPGTPPAEEPTLPPHRPAAVNGAPSAPQQSSDNLYENMSYELDDDED